MGDEARVSSEETGSNANGSEQSDRRFLTGRWFKKGVPVLLFSLLNLNDSALKAKFGAVVNWNIFDRCLVGMDFASFRFFCIRKTGYTFLCK